MLKTRKEKILTMKKLTAITLIAVLILSFSSYAFAADMIPTNARIINTATNGNANNNNNGTMNANNNGTMNNWNGNNNTRAFADNNNRNNWGWLGLLGLIGLAGLRNRTREVEK